MVPDRGHGGHWRLVATVVGLIIASSGLWYYLGPRQPNIPTEEDFERQEPTYSAGGAECDPQWLTGLSGRHAEGIRQACADGAEEHRLKRKDLLQQARSANAAEEIVWLTVGQARAAQVGTVFGFLTLIAAVSAAWFARRAAVETGRTAEAAFQSNEVATRAFMFPDGFTVRSARITYSDGTPSEIRCLIECSFLNMGTGPARVNELALGRRIIDAIEEPASIDWSNALTKTEHETFLGPGVRMGIGEFELTLDEAKRMHVGQSRLFIRIQIDYANFFDLAKKYHTQQGLKLR